MNKTYFSGAITALITPMKRDNLEIDFESVERLIDFQLENGIKALVICGTTGEAPTLTENEKTELFRVARERTQGKAKIIAGCGSPSTEFTLRLAKSAEKIGCDGILTVTPYYNKCSDEGIVAHYTAIAENISLPIIAYNVPSRTGYDLKCGFFEKMLGRENFIGVKEASGSVTKAAEIKALYGERYAVYSGCDELNAPLYAVGADGVVSVVSNIMPKEVNTLCEYCEKGNLADAKNMQLYLYPMIKALFSEVNPIPVKEMLSQIGLCENTMRLPLTPIEPGKLTKLKEALSSYKLI